jgi:hypothetical protein
LRELYAILVGAAVSDHNSFETGMIQLFGLLLGHVDKCLCADGNEMGNVGLLRISASYSVFPLREEEACGS